MKKLTYFAVFEPVSNDGYSVFFPDVPGCFSVGKDFNEALKKAKEALELHYYGLLKDNEEIPKPSTSISYQDAQGCIVSLVTIYPDLEMDKLDHRKVKTNCTLSAWLKEIAEINHVNYSQILESALKQKLGINESLKI